MDTNSKINLPLVSILMLTYNRSRFIRKAIQSVIEQNYTNWELIIIDDGSIDDTEKLIEGFNDSRINYIKHTENLGLFARRQESLSYTKGKYTAILDSDDYWNDPNKLTEQVDFLENHPNHVIIGSMTTLVDSEDKTIGQSCFSTTDTSIRKKILTRNQFTHSSILFRSATLQKTFGYQPTLAEDLELILQIGNFGNFANLEGFYTAHRVHESSMNDHGLKMALAVHAIVLKHQKYYPNSFIAIVFSFARLTRGYIKKFFTRKP